MQKENEERSSEQTAPGEEEKGSRSSPHKCSPSVKARGMHRQKLSLSVAELPCCTSLVVEELNVSQLVVLVVVVNDVGEG